MGCLHALTLNCRVRRFGLWLVTGITCGALAALAGVLIPKLTNVPLGSFQSNVVTGALVGFTYCALLCGALLRFFWDPSLVFAQLAYQCEQEERLPEAVAMYDFALSIRPDDVVLLYNRGTMYSRLGQYSEAIDDFDKARITPTPTLTGRSPTTNLVSTKWVSPTVIEGSTSDLIMLPPTAIVGSAARHWVTERGQPLISGERWSCPARPLCAKRP